MRHRMLTGAVVAGLMALAAPATAAPPVDVDQTVVLPPVLTSCDFEIEYVLSGKTKFIELSGGRTITTAPGQRVTLTNLVTEEQVTYNITGSFHTTQQAGGIVRTMMVGRNLVTDPEAGFQLIVGRFFFSARTTPFEVTETLNGKGQMTDVCEALS